MPKIYVSSIIAAPANSVWPLVRDFNGLPQWHPAIAESRIESNFPADKVGCVRNFLLADGGRIREQLLGLSDFDFACTYAILESPMDLTNYVATIALRPITESNRTFIEWTAEFDCAPEREQPLSELISRDVFQAGFDALKKRFGG